MTDSPSTASESDSAPVYTEESAREMVEASQEILRRGMEGECASVLTAALELARQSVLLFEADTMYREAAMATLGNLGPVLALEGHQDEFESHMTRMIFHGSACDGVATNYSKALLNTFSALAHHDRCPELMESLTLSRKLAELDPQQPSRWTAFIEVAHQAIRFLGTIKDLDRIGEVMTYLASVPESAQGECVLPLARTLSTLIILTVDANDLDKAEEGTRRLDDLMRAHPEEAVVLEFANALSCLIEVTVYRHPEMTTRIRPWIDRLLEVTIDSPHREHTRILTLTAPAIMAAHLCLADHEALTAFIHAAEGAVSRTPGDEELSFNLARGLVTATRFRNTQRVQHSTGWLGRLRALFLPPLSEDPLILSIRNSLRNLVRLAPDSSYLSLESRNFTKETGIEVGS